MAWQIRCGCDKVFLTHEEWEKHVAAEKDKPDNRSQHTFSSEHPDVDLTPANIRYDNEE